MYQSLRSLFITVRSVVARCITDRPEVARCIAIARGDTTPPLTIYCPLMTSHSTLTKLMRSHSGTAAAKPSRLEACLVAVRCPEARLVEVRCLEARLVAVRCLEARLVLRCLGDRLVARRASPPCPTKLARSHSHLL